MLKQHADHVVIGAEPLLGLLVDFDNFQYLRWLVVDVGEGFALEIGWEQFVLLWGVGEEGFLQVVGACARGIGLLVVGFLV